MPVLNLETLSTALISYTRDQLQRSGFKRLTVAVSGGLDSAVTLALAARAVGPKNVTAVYIDVDSSETSRNRARAAAKAQDVQLIEESLTDMCHAFRGMAHERAEEAGIITATSDLIEGSLRSTIRAFAIRYYNRISREHEGEGVGGLVMGTGNEDEDYFLRYYQRGGDGEVDGNYLSNLSKGELMQLALHWGVPLEIVTATPTAELHGVGAVQTDEKELTDASDGTPWTYSRVNEEGQYTRIGTIEATARWIDFISPRFSTVVSAPNLNFFSIYGANPEGARGTLKSSFEPSLHKFGLTVDHAVWALKWEKKTRYKHNPALPGGPTRLELIEAGAITNELPEIAA